MVMKYKTRITLVPRCRKCGSPTNLTSGEQALEKPVNVYRCTPCDKLSACVESTTADTFAG